MENWKESPIEGGYLISQHLPSKRQLLQALKGWEKELAKEILDKMIEYEGVIKDIEKIEKEIVKLSAEENGEQ